MLRCKTLKQICEIPVSYYTQNNVNYYVFGPRNKPIKTVCTYRKAKIFAQGIEAGKNLAAEKIWYD